VCASVTGDVYVSDTVKHVVHVFDSSGTYVRAIGVCVCEESDADGVFCCPVGVAVTRDRRAFVVDRGNHRVQAFE